MSRSSFADILRMQQQWKEHTKATNTWRSFAETDNSLQTVNRLLADSLASARSVQEALKTARQFVPTSLANWRPVERAIMGNPVLWHSLADTWASQVSMAQSVQRALQVFPQADLLRSLQSSLSGIAGRITTDVLKKENDPWIPVFRRTNEEATAIVAGSVTQSTITVKEIQRLETLISESVAAIKDEIAESRRSPMNFAAFVLTIIGIILSLIPLLVDHYKELDEQNATKHDIEEVRQLITTKYEQAVKQFLPQRVLRLNCPVRIRPSGHGKILQTLRAGDTVTLINTNHKWANISFLDEEKWPVTGWILKKYLKAFNSH